MAAGSLGEYLRARRALVTPADADIPETGRRRVPGLKRGEVAMLAGISAEYYTRLEQGMTGTLRPRSSPRSPGRCASTSPRRLTCSSSPRRSPAGGADLSHQNGCRWPWPAY
jgi:hypothetical protein